MPSSIKLHIWGDHACFTIPEKPNSRLQKYRLTDKGRSFL